MYEKSYENSHIPSYCKICLFVMNMFLVTDFWLQTGYENTPQCKPEGSVVTYSFRELVGAVTILFQFHTFQMKYYGLLFMKGGNIIVQTERVEAA